MLTLGFSKQVLDLEFLASATPHPGLRSLFPARSGYATRSPGARSADPARALSAGEGSGEAAPKRGPALTPHMRRGTRETKSAAGAARPTAPGSRRQGSAGA